MDPMTISFLHQCIQHEATVEIHIIMFVIIMLWIMFYMYQFGFFSVVSFHRTLNGALTNMEVYG